jgi:glycosyltransferase involved in cell wall biosynthesis
MNRQDSKTPLVSVVIPCYNCEKVVGRAISSVLSQTYPNIELLLVDNNSTDETLRVLKELEQKHPTRITVFSENKKGACAARNLGLLKSDGEWVQFLDADDELLPLKIGSQIQFATAANADIVVDDYCRIGDKGSQTSRQILIAENDPWLGVINSKLGVTSAILWKREKLMQVKGWNEKLGSSQEYDLLFRLLKQGAEVSTNHQVHTLVYAHSESVSRTSSAKKLFQILYNRYDLRCRIYDYMHDNKLLKSNYKQHLDEYLYYHLLLISEVNMSYFKEQVRNNGFEQISLPDRIKVYINFIRHSSKRKYGYSNKLLKLAEWQYFFCRNLHLLKV